MVESSDDPSLLDRIRPHTHASLRPKDRRPSLPVSRSSTRNGGGKPDATAEDGNGGEPLDSTDNSVAEGTSKTRPAPAPSPQSDDGVTSATIEPVKQDGWPRRFIHTGREILFSSWINVLLIFVPIGIVTNYTGISPTIVFVVNAIAIIPLAGLLSHATESVAASMGDTMGALLNVSFGNAVELIIFIIALVKNEIRIVQASLLGSILANLLLILGMSFAVGGLRYREQIYNSTVTQMSACLLSLSVMSLLLPTAFHASFSNTAQADAAVLQVSRGTSIILLLLYVLYLLFQLKSHAYMYESTPQHVIDEESHPGLLHDMLNSSSSSDTTGSSSDDESDASSDSHTTAKRIRRALRGRRRRKSSASSKEAPSSPSTLGTATIAFVDPLGPPNRNRLGAIASGDEADGEEEICTIQPTTVRDFENEKITPGSKSPEPKSKKKSKRKHRKHHHCDDKKSIKADRIDREKVVDDVQPCVSFAQDQEVRMLDGSPKRPFTIRGLSVRPGTFLTSTVFSATNPTGPNPGLPSAANSVPRAPYGLRRTSSLPDRLNKHSKPQSAPPAQPMLLANASSVSVHSDDSSKEKKYISRTSAVVLLLISTGLVALCAEYLVSSINFLVDSTGVSQTFIGLIVLPIVGNAAEHVTAVTVASKNKMDLAIGVAVGSSIQIALFVTPVVVLLGWILSKDMSLYFSLFETVSLFVSAFIVNFLCLDGRSNYLEGTLLMAAYIIIAIAAFFYPNAQAQSEVGGSSAGGTRMF